MIFEDSAKWFVNKYLDPCKICLVQVTCNPTSLRGKCELYNKYLKRLGQADTWGSNVDVWTFLIMAGTGVLFILTTFGLGLWKWVELIF